MKKINSDTFAKIIRGEYYRTQDEYNKFYVQADYSNEIIRLSLEIGMKEINDF